jgi:CubicO group peptidase (beta-lactamase class C family)
MDVPARSLSTTLKLMLKLTSRLPVALVVPLLLSACQSLSPSASPATSRLQDPEVDARIKRVELDVIPLDSSRRDAGPARSIAQRMAELHVPGLSIALFDEGRIQWAKGYGVRDVQTGAPVDASTLFQAASVSKPVSAVGMFRLAEMGKLSLDDDVNLQLKGWKLPENEFTRTEKVTLRRVVTHMAGLTGHGFYGYAPGAPIPTLAQILDGAPPANSPPVRVDAVPVTIERYSGGGFVLMQLLMEERSGRPFAGLMDDLVLQRAGMRDSSFAQPLPVSMRGRATAGHAADGTREKGGDNVYPEQAAAGLWTTPSDLARFMLAVGRSYRGEPEGLLSQASARAMLTEVPGGSGQGFGLSGTGEGFRYRHDGGNIGFRCYAVAFAGTGRGVVFMTNSDSGAQLILEVAHAISRQYGWPALGVWD